MAAPQRTSFQACMEFAEVHSLYDIDPELRIMARTAGSTDGPLAERVRTLFVQKVQSYAQGLRLTPFLPPAPVISEGLFTLGSAGGTPFRLTPVELLRHTLVAGPSGAGKTTVLQPPAVQVRQRGGHLMVADFKDDLQWLAAQDDDFLIIHPNIPLNILDHPAYIERSDYINLLITLLTRAYYGGEHLRQVAHETLWITYRQYAHPSIEDLISVVRSRLTPKETFQRRDAYQGLLMRLIRILEQFPGMARTRVGIAHDTLWRHSLYLGALHQNDTTEFLTAWIVHNYYAWARAHQARNTALTYLILLDEGLLTFAEGNRIDGPVLLPLIPLLREYGAALAIATAHLGAIHETIRTNAYTIIALPQTNATDADALATTMGLDREQTAYLLKMHPGQALVRTGKWRMPFLIEFPPLPYTKNVNDAEWRAALERTNALAPQQPGGTTTTSPASIAQPHEKPTPVKLTRSETALLEHLGKVGVSSVKDAYTAAGLAPQVGDRAQKKLVTLGLIERDKLKLHPHKGGTGVGLRPTRRGYERIPDVKPPHRTRGGDSIQHEWLVTSIAAQIPDTTVEITLGTKSIDILWRITGKNAWIFRIIEDYATDLFDGDFALRDGDLIAIEVETTPANVVHNAQQNFAAGISLNITATMPEALDAAAAALREQLTPDELARCLLVDVFGLLENITEPAS